MIHEQLDEQASLYVLDALEPEETRAFEAQLATDDELREHVRSLADVAGSLAHAAPSRPLPSHLESRIMHEIRAQKPERTVITPLRTNWIPWAVAACLAIACAVAFSQRQRLTDRLAAAHQEAAAARDATVAAESRATAAQTQLAALAKDKDLAEQQLVELQQREADARTQMATLAAARDEALDKVARTEAREQQEERVARQERQRQPPAEQRQTPAGGEERDEFSSVQVATLTSKMSKAPNATAAVVWDAARQRGVLNGSNMPPNTDDRDYQLWIVDSRFADPVDAGVFHVEKKGSTRYVFAPKIRIESPSAFAVSVERRGGVAKAEGPIVLAGK
ncbi:MAG: hypothetical protein AVDCRST_MAG42-403 [uncultured Chthoniobacterales bacterium]|uniref:Regulator of SigK n=1 Tax=uncultured Chthoniobacterales bacterium TaxID=1836801 RepID=A0A6J4H9V5_9BACT|nr:MAG: hypothetical protein AVDCRST_MAG42-403 [uncultured Chthoniobacterales bacterium]